MTARLDTQPLHWGFSTLGCPELSFAEACELAAEFHLRAIELRSLWGRVDLPACMAEFGVTAAKAHSLLARSNACIPVAGSSFKLVDNDSTSRAEFLDFCEWAQSWCIPNVRVFGGGTWGQSVTEKGYNQAAETIAWWRLEKKVRGWKIEMLLETHDAFSASAPCCELMKRLDDPIGIIWDSHHTWRLGEEKPTTSWSRLGEWVRHVHLKDSIDKPSARHPYTYVLPGEGQAPLTEIVRVLREHDFSGIISLEWERLWHPYLLPLRSALSHLRLQPWFNSASGELTQKVNYQQTSDETERRSIV